jgi:hypothetical protein
MPKTENGIKITENNIKDLLKKWIEKNPKEFRKDEFREATILDRCQQYRDAPEDYLRSMLKILPDIMKWYFNVFQTVFIAGLVGLETTLFVMFLSNLSAWFQRFPQDWGVLAVHNVRPIDVIALLSWMIPLLVLSVILFFALKTNKKYEASYLSHFIQKRFWIYGNLKEAKIEMYCISMILKIRQEDSSNTK